MRRAAIVLSTAGFVVFVLAAAAPRASAATSGDFCSQTARLLFSACGAQVTDDSFVKEAVCTNIEDAAERGTCLQELADERAAGNQLCQDQLDTRLGACLSLGEGRYDPDIDASLFDNPKEPTRPNPYFPLRVGSRWTFRAPGVSDTVEVQNATKLIDGVGCIVVRDRVTKDGDLAEDTDDWYAQAKDGTTWYFGEMAKDFESFDGDNPRKPELVSIDGSFKAGRDGDKPGVIFLASPKKGDVYLEEFSLANAEDVTEILSTKYAFGKNAELDQSVPRELAQRLCAGDCVVTRNFSLLEPGIFARKYYARGIGVFLEVEVVPDEPNNVIQLVSCNVDSRCRNLPKP
jgi:hypothetical protein